VELGRSLHAGGYRVRACDPSQPALPADLSFIELKSDAPAAAAGADAIVVCTPWPVFRELDWPGLIGSMRRPLLIDVGRFLEECVSGIPNLHYVTIGSPR
jgi:UDPglucose 6-dehydrogenase